ncbi:MAG: glycosyl hydrolase [Acidobacteriaceae bacterium]
MKAALRLFLVPLSLGILLFFPNTATVAQAQAQTQAQASRPWQQVTVPSTSEVAANFKAPPHEYGAISPFTGWDGPDPEALKKRITDDLDRMSANGMFVFNLASGRKSPGEPPYLSPGHMDEVKFIVQEAAKRNMRFWIQDESNYPSGFAGGYIQQRYPELTMQVMTADITLRGEQGQTVAMPVPPDTLAIWAAETTPSGQVLKVTPIPLPADGQLKWVAPSTEGATPDERHTTWQVRFLRHEHISSPTRNDNRADGGRAKDGTYSLIDYLDPKATDAFLHITEETYYGAVGDQFGKIVLGFFGDEPDYSENNTTGSTIIPGSAGVPWTPTLLEQFKAQKGYDLTPYLPAWFDGQPTEKSNLAHADYYDVWSGIFRNSFFGEQANWAKAHNVEYLVHLNHEETMLSLENSEGDYFRDERYVEVPGIDNLSQLIPSAVHRFDSNWSTNNNFPKLASSDAHLFGKPKVWAEEGGGSGVDGKYQMNFQLVRGVNALQIRANGLRAGGFGGQAAGPPPPDTAQTIWYANRAGYLIAIGRPAAQVGLYHPGNTIWLGGQDATEADRSTTKLGWQLFEHQVDWDYFDEQSLSSVATISNGGFTNLSGQTYKAIVFPSMTVITRTGLQRLQEFAKAGGKVIFVGKTPSLIMDKTYMDAKQEKPDLSFATLIEPSGDITAAVLAALPKPDVKLDSEFKRLTYTHRKFTDGDLYFFFNESTATESRVATIAGHGTAQNWDLATGEIHPMTAAKAEGDSVTIPLVLGPYEAKVVVVGPLAKGIAAAAEPSFASGEPVADLSGDWKLDLNGKQLTTPIKPWEELGSTSFAGPVTYTMQFTPSAAPKGKHVCLEIADVHDYAKVMLNGKEVGARSFQPYRWDVTSALKKGANDLKIEVYANVAGGGRGAGALPAAGATATAGLATLPAGGRAPGAAGAPAAAGAGRGGRGGRGGGAAAGAPVAGAPPAGGGGGGRGGAAPPATSGLLGLVKLVAY